MLIRTSKIYLFFIYFFIYFFISFSTNAENGNIDVEKIPSSKLKLEKVLETSGVIWGFDFVSKSQVVYSIRDGQLFHFNLLNKKTTKLKIPSVYSKGQGGLLDVQVYKVNKINYIYITFSELVNDIATTSLARVMLSEFEGSPKIGNWEILFQAKIKSNTNRHFGSRLVRADDFIFMTIGDRGERKYAQDKNLHNGSIVRLNMEGKGDVWSYGHRNPQGIDIDPVSGNIYSCEFGPRGGDELNLILEGKNYGWPTITYGSEYWGPKIGETNKKGMEQPVMYWTPSISPSGMVFYTGDKTKEWKHNLFLANLSSTHLRRIILKDNKVIEQFVLLEDLGERFRHVRNGPDGYLYVSTDSGKIYRISK